eukprot:gene3135-2137_t
MHHKWCTCTIVVQALVQAPVHASAPNSSCSEAGKRMHLMEAKDSASEQKMSVEEQFDISTQIARGIQGLNNDQKLKIYSLYKQSTEGDVKGNQPWAVQVQARAKWDAWKTCNGMGKKDAMQEYIDTVETFQNEH